MHKPWKRALPYGRETAAAAGRAGAGLFIAQYARPDRVALRPARRAAGARVLPCRLEPRMRGPARVVQRAAAGIQAARRVGGRNIRRWRLVSCRLLQGSQATPSAARGLRAEGASRAVVRRISFAG